DQLEHARLLHLPQEQAVLGRRGRGPRREEPPHKTLGPLRLHRGAPEQMRLLLRRGIRHGVVGPRRRWQRWWWRQLRRRREGRALTLRGIGPIAGGEIEH